MSDAGQPGRPLCPPDKEFGNANEQKKLKKHPEGPSRPHDHRAFRRAQTEPRRWNRHRKKEHYDKNDEELLSLKCHDEMFATGSNAKFWTHLLNGGVTAGGQSEKLDVSPKRKTGHHLKSGLYKGKYETVAHKQVICRARRKDHTGKLGEDRQVDHRPKFDNRLKDDMMKRNDETDRELAAASSTMFMPSVTRSCPQMGAEWMHR